MNAGPMFEFVDEVLKRGDHALFKMKAIEQCFLPVQFIVLYEVVVTFERALS